MKLLVFFLLISIRGASQISVDIGQTKTDSEFACDGFLNVRDGKGLYYTTDLTNICQSKNDLDLRLFVAYAPSFFSWDLYVLTYGNKEWSLKWYSCRKRADTTIIIKPTILKPKEGFESFYTLLKTNNVFTLPDQSTLPVQTEVLDGTLVTLTYKASGIFRSYHFNNPDIYRSAHKDIKEFENYYNIANAFFRGTEK